MVDDERRSRATRAAAETALAHIVYHHGSTPAFVLLGGLMPDYLCGTSAYQHAGTTDVDVQVDLELAAGAVHAIALERALRAAGFHPDTERVWRWSTVHAGVRAVIKFELLADTEAEQNGTVVRFAECEALGAVNLRGTGYASRDVQTRTLTARIESREQVVEINTAGLAGFLLAKTFAARNRRKTKDWYDIAFVLLHNDAGGPEAAADAILARFSPSELGQSAVRTALDDLAANFSTPSAQGPLAYAEQMALDHQELDRRTLAADAVVAVRTFHARLTSVA